MMRKNSYHLPATSAENFSRTPSSPGESCDLYLGSCESHVIHVCVCVGANTTSVSRVHSRTIASRLAVQHVASKLEEFSTLPRN